MNRLLLLAVVVSLRAFALTSDAKLLPEEQVAAPQLEPIHWGYQFAAGSAAAVVSVPLSLGLAAWVGSWSNNLYAAALPALFIFGLIPPIAVTLACWIAGNWNTPGAYRWWPSLIANILINGASLFIGAMLGLSFFEAPRVILYTVVQAILQPAASTALMRAWPKSPPPQVITVRDPVSPSIFFAPTSVVTF
jgi:hypothetical protein